MKRTVFPIFIYFVLAASGVLAADQNTVSKIFMRNSLKVQAGMTAKEVITILGKPDHIEKTIDVNMEKLGATLGYTYWRPGYATTFVLVGLNDGIVAGAVMCKDVGSRVHTTECEPLKQYWKNEF